MKEYINNISPTENDIRRSMCSFLYPLEPIGTNSTPCFIICDFTSLLGHAQLDLVTHWLAIDIYCLECNVNAIYT